MVPIIGKVVEPLTVVVVPVEVTLTFGLVLPTTVFTGSVGLEGVVGVDDIGFSSPPMPPVMPLTVSFTCGAAGEAANAEGAAPVCDGEVEEEL